MITNDKDKEKCMEMNLIKRVIQNNFIKNVFTVASGTALIQVISILVSPIITRLYGPESFGIYGVFTSVLSIVLPITSLTYDYAIVLPFKDEDARDLGILSGYIALFISLVVFIIVSLWSNKVASFLNLENIESFLVLIPLVMLLSSLIQIISQWYIRKSNFKIITKVGIINSLFMNITKVIIGFLIPSASALIIVFVISQGFHFAFLIIGVGSISLLKPTVLKNRYNIISLAKQFREFPLYRAPQSIINALSSNLPILLLTTLFGPAIAGFYTMSNRVLNVPVTLLGKSVGDVFYPRIAEAVNNKEKIDKILVKSTITLIMVGILPFGFLILWGPSLFSILFGSEWVVSGVYTRWLAIWIYTSLINIPSVKSLPVLKAQKFHLIHTILTITFKALALWIGGVVIQSDLVAVALYSITAAILNIFLIIYTIFRAKEIES